MKNIVCRRNCILTTYAFHIELPWFKNHNLCTSMWLFHQDPQYLHIFNHSPPVISSQKNSVSSGIRVFKINKTRGLRRWPTRETIVLRCNKLNPGSTEIFEIRLKILEILGTCVPTSQECVHKHSERYFIQNLRYPSV